MCIFSDTRPRITSVFCIYRGACCDESLYIFRSEKIVKHLVLLTLLPLLLFTEKKEEGYDPWYTGTLLATGASNVLPGDLTIQPYLTFTWKYGNYQNNWSMKNINPFQYTLSPALFLEWGVTDWLDFNLMPTMFTKWRGSETSTHLADTYTALGFQLLNDKKHTPYPDMRLVTIVTFPTGRFEEADVPQFVTDFSGAGAIEYGVVLSTAKKFYIDPMHPFRITTNLGYSRSTSVKINGFSVYGGGRDARGTVQPGSAALFNLTLEYSITQPFTIAVENIIHWVGKTTFKGFEDGKSVGSPESFLFTFCPEIEYSFSQNQGVVAGLWWHYAGKNSPAFLAPVVSYVYTY